MTKAVGLFSGGLDSVLAIMLIKKQGIDVTAVAFRSPFFIASDIKKNKMEDMAKRLGFKIKFIDLGKDYLKLVKKPKHGHGKNMNPCIDCHAFMFKQAKKYASKIGAKFIFSGEVLDERPMSQNMGSLRVVAKEAGLKGKMLRPLSAKLLKETEAEKKGYVDRSKLLDLKGRSRKPQIKLAKEFKIGDYETPAGGCLLTSEAYSVKLKDLFDNKKMFSLEDVKLLKAGRHFRFEKNKIIVGRDKEDNELLLKLKGKSDYKFQLKGQVGPITLLQGKKIKKAIELAASLTLSHSKAENKSVVEYGKSKFNKEIVVDMIDAKKIEKIRI